MRLEPGTLAQCVLNTSRSQSREDILLLPTLIALVGLGFSGTFIELGAYNGLVFSNTIALEQCAGWRGLLIEANPVNYADLVQSNRSSEYVHAGICAAGTGSINISLAGGPAAGQHTKSGDHIRARYRVKNDEVAVPCWPLSTLMARGGMQRAHLLSLDVVRATQPIHSAHLCPG